MIKLTLNKLLNLVTNNNIYFNSQIEIVINIKVI
jgi:hypothetical protein